MQDLAFATANAEVDTESIRRETLEGRDHLVAPVVAVQEMVLKGEFLPAEEIAASTPAWNGVVLPIGHPTDASGEFVSANSPDVHDEQTVGRFFEAEERDGALVGEIWVDIDRSKELAAEHNDERFVKPLAILATHRGGDDAANVTSDLPPALDAVANADAADVLEVSTAYFYEQQQAMGTHDGQQYDATQHNLLPDHLALLPNSVGECSAEDGCGAPRTHVHANVDGDERADGATENEADDARHFGGPPADGEQAPLTTFESTNMNTDELREWLANRTEFDEDTLATFEDSHLETLKESVDAAASHDHDGDCQCNECAGADAQNSGDGDDGPTADVTVDVPDAVQEELSDLREKVESFESRFDAQEQAERDEHIDAILNNSDRFDRDTLEAIDETDALEALRAEVASPGANFGGRIGAGEDSDPGGADDDLGAYEDMVRQANPTRFGGAEADD